jgi:hypothetical protein
MGLSLYLFIYLFVSAFILFFNIIFWLRISIIGKYLLIAQRNGEKKTSKMHVGSFYITRLYNFNFRFKMVAYTYMVIR